MQEFGFRAIVIGPGELPAQREEVAEVELPNGRVALLSSPEDVLVYRLHEFLAEDRAARQRLRELVAGLPKPYRREGPRDPEEAGLLRERGTPERLIGPEGR